jgi:hypothetical protein
VVEIPARTDGLQRPGRVPESPERHLRGMAQRACASSSLLNEPPGLRRAPDRLSVLRPFLCRLVALVPTNPTQPLSVNRTSGITWRWCCRAAPAAACHRRPQIVDTESPPRSGNDLRVWKKATGTSLLQIRPNTAKAMSLPPQSTQGAAPALNAPLTGPGSP